MLILCFTDSFVQKTLQQLDGSCVVTSNTKLACKLFRQESFFFANIWKKIVSKEYCFTHHDYKMCFPPKCRYHNVLIGHVGELLQKVDAFCFTYQHVYCLYTIFKCRFSGNCLAKSGHLSDNTQRVVCANQQLSVVDRIPNIAKKLLREKYRRISRGFSKKTIPTQANDSIFAERIEQVGKTRVDLEVLKFVDCFLECYGKHISCLVTTKTNYI